MINPDTLAPPRGYQNGLLLPPGYTLFVAGQIGWDRDAKIVSESLTAQFRQAMRNVLDVVEAAGGTPDDVGRFTIYITDRDEYVREVKAIGAAYRDVMGKTFPAMALVQVAALLEPRAKVEIEATAVIPADRAKT